MRFTFDRSFSEADFLIEYNAPNKWNDIGYYTRYTLYALPRITGKGMVSLGGIRLFSTEQQCREANALARIMEYTPVFTTLDESFLTTLSSEEGARQLFLFLDPKQREEFVRSLHICLDPVKCKDICYKKKTIYQTLFRRVYENRYRDEKDQTGKYVKTFREDEMWREFDAEALLPIRKYLCSELSVDDIITMEELASNA